MLPPELQTPKYAPEPPPDANPPSDTNPSSEPSEPRPFPPPSYSAPVDNTTVSPIDHNLPVRLNPNTPRPGDSQICRRFSRSDGANSDGGSKGGEAGNGGSGGGGGRSGGGDGSSLGGDLGNTANGALTDIFGGGGGGGECRNHLQPKNCPTMPSSSPRNSSRTRSSSRTTSSTSTSSRSQTLTSPSPTPTALVTSLRKSTGAAMSTMPIDYCMAV
ncbi:hypothetical protein ABVK25_011594 [Lepraria finkii]|uniref:Uncharacterized protein n=1 Tax=Lepraria finkii TaxID=1340010 RepID=A0ABR4ALW4_9LECA